MPRYNIKNVRVTGKPFGQSKFWIDLVDIGMWSTGKLDAFVSDVQESRSKVQDLVSDLEGAVGEDREEILNAIKQGESFFREKLAELIVNWNLIDVDDESDKPKTLPLPMHGVEVFDKVPTRFISLITDEMARMLGANTEVPLANGRRF